MVILRLLGIASLICLSIGAGAVAQLLPPKLRSRAAPRLSTWLCRAACRLLRFKVTFDGEPPSGRPALLVANHVSWTDVIVLGGRMHVCFLARHDVAGWPALGLLARMFGTLFIERGRLKQIPRVNAAIAERMAAGDLVGLFAEATTGDGTRLKRFHAVHLGAARDLLRQRPDFAGVMVAPVAIAYSHRRGLPLGRRGRTDVAWFGDTEFAPHLLDLVRSGGVECRISFLHPVLYDRASERKAVGRKIATAVKLEVGRLLGALPTG